MADPSMHLPDDPPFRTRIDVLFARDAPKAVLLRRGPKRHFHLISWDLENDKFTHGQWMHASGLRLCDLSPDGDRLIYWAAQYHRSTPRDVHAARHVQRAGASGAAEYDPLLAFPAPRAARRRRKVPRYLREGSGAARGRNYLKPRTNEGVWTAVSTPPFFSALAIWPCLGHWTGGGVFLSDNRIVLYEESGGLIPDVNVPIPGRFNILSVNSLRQTGQGLRTCAFNPARNPDDRQKKLTGHLQGAGAHWVEWVCPHKDGSLLFACDGCIYRLRNWEKTAPEDLLSQAKMLADLRPLTFKLMAPPQSAMRW